MIRINLLATERAAAKAPSAPGTLQLYLMLIVAVGAAVLLCGGLWWSMNSEIVDLEARIAAKEQEKTALQAIQKQVEELQRKEKSIQEQVKLIEDLQRQRDTAMEIMAVISESLPDFVWLTDMNQTGNRITFKGKSATLTAVADFITNLQDAGEHCGKPDPASRTGCYFPEVNLLNSVQQQNSINFDLAATFQPPRPPAPPADAAKAGQPAAAAPAAQG